MDISDVIRDRRTVGRSTEDRSRAAVLELIEAVSGTPIRTLADPRVLG